MMKMMWTTTVTVTTCPMTVVAAAMMIGERKWMTTGSSTGRPEPVDNQ